MEYLFSQCPVSSQHPREQGARRAAYYTYEVVSPDQVTTTVDAILSDFTSIARLYQLVLQFSTQLSASRGLCD